MARPCYPIPPPKCQSAMRLTRAEWKPNKPSPSGDALKTNFKCTFYGTAPVAPLAPEALVENLPRPSFLRAGSIFTSKTQTATLRPLDAYVLRPSNHP